MRIISLFITVVALVPQLLFGQCGISSDGIEIEDFTTTDIEITVSDVLNNSLASPDQGLCSVKLHFTHAFVGDISMTLTSPSGQTVNILGPAGSSTAPTNLVKWQVNIVDCEDDAEPDTPLFSDNFSNNESWGNFATYTGSYYPFSGCFTDLNTGPVNGVWTLSTTDVSFFGAGEFTYIEFVFCDGSSSDCFICDAQPSELPDGGGNYCEGDPSLDLDISPVFTEDIPNADHSYRYVLVEDGEIVNLINSPNLSGLSFGDYQLCGLSGNTGQLNDLSDDLIGEDYADVEDILFDEGYCVQLSSNCLSFNIVEVPDTVLVQELICSGDSIVINDVAYTETGLFVTSPFSSTCDTVELLELIVLQNEAVITFDTLQIGCSNPIATLDASSSTLNPQTTLEWFSLDATIEPTDANKVQLQVETEGTYGLSIQNNICSDTAYVTVVDDGTSPTFSFNVDPLSCIQPLVTIDMEPSEPLQSQMWTGPISASSEDILVAAAGTYYVEGVTLNGCIGRDSVVVVENLDVFDPILTADTITCGVTIASITSSLPDSLAFDFSWSGPGLIEATENSDVAQVTEPGIYELELRSLDNGCIETFAQEVLIDTSTFISTVSSEVLTCTNDSIPLVITNFDTLNTYQWLDLSSNIIGTGDSVVVVDTALYLLETTFHNACKDTIYHSLEYDIDPLPIEVLGGEITCASDSIMISVTLYNNAIYNWSGPLMFQSNVSNPFVSVPGVYSVSVQGPNGCISNGSANVTVGADIPNIIFERDTLDCNVLATKIIPSDSTNLVFDWMDDNVFQPTTNTWVIDQPGLYPVTIMDTITQCHTTYEVEVFQNIELPQVTWIPDTLNCLIQSIEIDAEYIDLDSLRWYNDDISFESKDVSPTLTEGGTYHLEMVGTNGCILEESFVVIQDTIIPSLTWNNALLNCTGPEVELEFFSDLPILESTIVFPDLTIVENSFTDISETGEYKSIIKSTNQCVDSIEVDVLRDTVAPNLEVMLDGDLSCLKFTAEITAQTNEEKLDFSWSGPAISAGENTSIVTVIDSGLYTIMVTDTALCVSTASIYVSSSIDFPELNLITDIITCSMPEVEVISDPDLVIDSISWRGPISIPEETYSFSTTQDGWYYVRARGVNNCITLDSIEVAIDTLTPSIEVSDYGILDCNIESLDIIVNSNLDDVIFDWVDPASTQVQNDTITVTLAGEYNLTATAPNGCVNDTLLFVEQDTLRPMIEVPEIPRLTCINGKAILSIETNENVIAYAWDGPSGEFDVAEPLVVIPGLYGVTVTNDLGCSASTEIEVINDTQGPSVELRDTFYTCDLVTIPLPIEVTDTDSISYFWEGPDGFISNIKSPLTNTEGEYIIYAQLERNGCITVASLNVGFQEVKPIYETSYQDLDCINDEVTLKALDVDDDQSAIWYDDNDVQIGVDSVSIQNEGDYYLIVTGENTCKDTFEVEILEDFEHPSLSIELNEPFECENKQVVLNGIIDDSDNLSIEWTTIDGEIVEGINNKDATVFGAGTYMLKTVFDRNGCESIDSITLVDGIQSMVGLETETMKPYCLGDSNGFISVTDIIGGYSPYTYSIDSTEFVSTSMFDSLSLGSYYIEVKDSVGCIVSTEVQLEDGFLLMADIGLDTSIVVGEPINIESIFNIADSEMDSIFWFAQDTLVSCDYCFDIDQTPLFTTRYIVEGRTVDGCVARDTMFVTVDRRPTVWVANIFAPSSVSGNNLFYVQQTLGVERVLKMQVFDKWSNEMFKAENVPAGDPSFAWDGYYKGKPVNSGVYMVHLQILLKSGELIQYTTDLTVVR